MVLTSCSMAEALALASGLATLLSLVTVIADTSSKFVRNVCKASEEIQSYFSELAALKKVLVELDGIIHKPKYEALLVQRGYRTFTCDGVSECRQELELHQEKLQKATSGSIAHVTWNRLRWPFTTAETQKLVDKFHRYQGIFHASLSIQGL